jgi:hypothetical protein
MKPQNLLQEFTMKTTRLLTVIIVLQGLLLLGQWTGHSPMATAYGQVADPGAQRIQMVDQLKDLNGKMDKLMDLLQSGDVQVKVAPADEKKAAPGR